MSRKSNLMSMLTMIMVAMLSINFISCGQDDDDVTKKPDDGKEQTDVVSNQDPEGTIVININNGSRDNWVDIGIDSKIHIDDANNFVGNNSSVEFASIGLVSGLGKVTTIPSTGWAKTTAVVPGTGYIARYGNRYARLYVVNYIVNTSGGIMGATVKYQSPFQLPIILESTSLTFTSNASSQSINMKDPTSVMIESKPIWCTVSIGSNSITVSVTENLSAQQYTGDIVLKNSVSSVILSVVQKGSSSPKFEGGRGTEDDPYQIKTAQQLDNVRLALSAHFKLLSDINLSSYLNENGSGWDPIGTSTIPFTGRFHGNNNTIRELWIKRATTDNVGLFGCIKNAVISDVKILIGADCITGAKNVGGVCGDSKSSNISHCLISGTIISNYDGWHYVGGICGGEGTNTKISQCCTDGSIISQGADAGAYGICRYAEISNCYSTAHLTGDFCRGIAEGNDAASKCYFAGKVTSRYTFYCGGEYTYFDKDVAGISITDSYQNNTARTTLQMMTQSTYEGWDFDNIWRITEGKTYPTLRCFDK